VRILDNEDAASQVLNILLIIVMIVTLAGITVAFVFGIGGPVVKGPTASILVKNNPESTGIIDMKIVHAGGDSIKAGDWKLSIVEAGDPPSFQIANTDFRVGDQIVTTNLTDGTGTYTITNTAVYTTGTADTLKSGIKYNVQIIIYPFKTLTVDTIIILK